MKTLSVVLTLLFVAVPAVADDFLVSRPSAHDVPTTVARLETILQEKGLKVFARIDHEANASAVGMEMPPSRLLIFGKAEVGTGIMQDDPRAGLDLPLRVLVYADREGNTQILYRSPQALPATYSLDGNPAPAKIAGALEAITAGAAE